jgi:hypothetical protein
MVLDFSRLRTGEIVVAVGGLALFIFMFFDWFGGGVEISTGGTQEIPGVGEVPSEPTLEETGVSGWDALQDFSGFLIALSAVSGVALAGLAASGRRLNLGGVPRGAGTAILGSLAVLLILWRFLANPGDLKIGIFLGLAAAIAVAVGALMALRENGFEPLAKVPGGRTRVAAASAPTATPVPPPVSPPGGGSGSGGSSSSSSGGSSTPKSRSRGSSASRSRSSGGSAKKSRSSGSRSRSTATKSRSSGSTGAKSRSGVSRSRSSTTKSRSGTRKTTAKRSTASRSSSGGSSRAKGSSRSKSSGSRSRSSGTRRRSSGGRK